MIINIRNKRFYYILLSILIFLIDQFSKYLININHNSLINNDFILITIVYVKNYGAAFDILSGSRIFLSTVSTIFSIVLIYFILIKKNLNNLNLLSYSFILGGTIGNGIDRINKGYVVDFINLNFIDFPVFNIADISINIGLLFIIYGYIKNKR
tara:strand:- start:126 stop:587 length:462 start_codon:yes stop_codon:yes gene_type:complete